MISGNLSESSHIIVYSGFLKPSYHLDSIQTQRTLAFVRDGACLFEKRKPCSSTNTILLFYNSKNTYLGAIKVSEKDQIIMVPAHSNTHVGYKLTIPCFNKLKHILN